MGCQQSSVKIDPQMVYPTTLNLPTPTSKSDKRRGSIRTTNLSKENSINSMEVKGRQNSVRNFSAICEVVESGSSSEIVPSSEALEILSSTDSKSVASCGSPASGRAIFVFKEGDLTPPPTTRSYHRAQYRYKPQPVEIAVQPDSWYQRPRPALFIEVK